MLSIAVCDDEVMERCMLAERIRDILQKMRQPCSVRLFGSGGELLQAPESFDMIFLDILMNGPDGMETARMFRQRAFDKILIFISSSREYVFQAYDVEAFQYLLKPVTDEKLKAVLERALWKTESRCQEFIIASREREKRKLFLDDIRYFEIQGRVMEVHGPEGVFPYYERIGALEDRLQEKGFFRCHKSYLINLRYVEGYNRQEAILDNGERIAIAKRRYEEFCREILQYMREHGGIV